MRFCFPHFLPPQSAEQPATQNRGPRARPFTRATNYIDRRHRKSISPADATRVPVQVPVKGTRVGVNR